MIDLQKAKDYLRVTYDEENEYIEFLIGVAKEYLKNAITDFEKKYKKENFQKQADMVLLFLVQNLFDERYYQGQDLKIQYMVTSMINQMEF